MNGGFDRLSAKKAILAAARENENWKLLARTFNIHERTASNWISRARKEANWSPERAQWGGPSNCKIEERHIERILEAISIAPDLTLEQMASRVATDFNVVVSATTISVHLDGRMNTLKKLHHEIEKMNTMENKLARREFLRELWRLVGDGREIFYLDETNYNTWCSREYGWSVKGQRAVPKRSTSKGENMQIIIACIGRAGLVYFKKKYGSNTAVAMIESVRELLDHLAMTIPLDDVVVVMDNAPCHRQIEQAFQGDPRGHPTLLRLGPYTPMLNPIESVFSVFKADVKKTLRERRQELLTIPPNTTIKAHRSRILEQAADAAIHVITPTLCWKCITHTQKFYDAVMNLEDVKVGN
ncbi:hypothetical protein LEN26_012100 [Aphanomyces euteiches]|nr:hypothetical protein LEN26_012100 [Aphanomyces euteiches]KAH9122043.1 hypothetical protein AeMF1_006481 [Aphanomyces euteiches]